MIADLKKQPLFQKAMAEVRKRHRPIVPNFTPANPISVDEWKYRSGMQDAFDLLFNLLTGGQDG